MRQALIVGVVLVLSVVVGGQWAGQGKGVPVDRLIQNTGAYIKEHPEEAQGYYLLGRLRSLAYAQTGAETGVVEKDGLPQFAPYQTIRMKPQAKELEHAKLTDEQKGHLLASIENYRIAAGKDQKLGIAFMGLGWMLEQAYLRADEVGPDGITEPPDRVPAFSAAQLDALIKQLGAAEAAERDGAFAKLAAELPSAVGALKKAKESDQAEVKERATRLLNMTWQYSAIRSYRIAFSLTSEQDRKKENFGPAADESISSEAAEGILRILQVSPALASDLEEADQMKAAFDLLMTKKRKVTPIVFSLKGNGRLDDLLSPEKAVGFDLAGDGVARKWPWVKGDTCILAWDPEQTGKIADGRQLFGSATWWIHFDNGYQALSRLDDDRDGWLSGKELRGLVVWRDVNGDGVSDAGEVVSVESAGIAAIGVVGTMRAGVWMSEGGIVRGDGVEARSFDWVARSR